MARNKIKIGDGFHRDKHHITNPRWISRFKGAMENVKDELEDQGIDLEPGSISAYSGDYSLGRNGPEVEVNVFRSYVEVRALEYSEEDTNEIEKYLEPAEE